MGTTARGALFVPDSGNHKICGNSGKKVATTYASIKGSCPRSCRLYQTKECYAMYGHVGLVVLNLDKGLDTNTASLPLLVARREAAAIDAAFNGGPIPQDGAKGGRDMRLHTSGDCRINKAAQVIAKAADRWRNRGGGAVWTYTHAWRNVRRSSWGNISVLASVDDVNQALMAVKAGYAPARYVAEFSNNRPWTEAGIKWIPCRAQTNGSLGCIDCRLCLNADRLHQTRRGIAFAAHGAKGRHLKCRLTK